MMENKFDVIIVGGRVSGSALAARLGRYGFRVLLLERATLPSLPAVSSPIIYSSTMKMLDEIGADEGEYARNTPKLYHMMSINAHYEGQVRLPEHEGRDYAYAIDRARFDAALWDNALAHPNVVGRQNFSVLDLLWEGERVVGVTGKAKGGDTEPFYADVVIGADGRFGIVSRKTEAAVRDEHEAHPTSIYYAYWKNVQPLPSGPVAAAYEGAGGYGYLAMDSADGETVVAIEGRSDALDPDAGQAEAFYLAKLKENTKLWTRMVNAQRVTTVRGMRNIGNSYKQPGGAGWALVGDAYHQKDPLDGQGIYNAVFTGKALALAMRDWKRGTCTWEQALAQYDERARIKTYPMYKLLQQNIRTNFYPSGPELPPVPGWAMTTVSRWVMEDPAFNNLMGQYLTRQLPPDAFRLLSTPVMLGAVARGPLRDLRKRIENGLSRDDFGPR